MLDSKKALLVATTRTQVKRTEYTLFTVMINNFTATLIFGFAIATRLQEVNSCAICSEHKSPTRMEPDHLTT